MFFDKNLKVNSRFVNLDYCYLHLPSELKHLQSDSQEISNSADFLLVNNYAGKIYRFPSIISNTINNLPDGCTAIDESYTIAANVDDNGNIYELRGILHLKVVIVIGALGWLRAGWVHDYVSISGNGIFASPADYYIHSSLIAGQTTLVSGYDFYDTTFKIQVIKNNQVVKEVGFTETIQKLFAEVKTYTKNSLRGMFELFIPQALEISIPWGVIENENNWAILSNIFISGTSYKSEPTGRPYKPRRYIHECTEHKNVLTITTQSKQQKIYSRDYAYMYLYSKGESLRVTHPHDIPIRDSYFAFRKNVAETFRFNDLLPIQDGYGFKINDTIPISDNSGPSSFEQYNVSFDVSILSPDGDELWRGKIALGTYFTLYKGVLLGVNDKGRLGIIANMIYPRSGHVNAYAKADIDSGLYLLHNGKLEQIASGYLKNQKIRPMKKYKKWWTRIQPLG